MNAARFILSLGLLSTVVLAQEVRPQVKGTPSIIANVTDPNLNRDSCGSVRLGDRALWVCRDTEEWNNVTNHKVGPVITNTASWTNFTARGLPDIIHNAPGGLASTGDNPVLLMYGGHPRAYPSFDPVLAGECTTPGGFCSNGSRVALWPSVPPMVAETLSNGTIVTYTWVAQHEIDNSVTLDPTPPYSLYRFDYDPADEDTTLNSTPVGNNDFWAEGEWGYGEYGNVVYNGTAYLYAQTENRTAVALARVDVSQIEDRSNYQYYVNGRWVSEVPSLSDSSAFIDNLNTNGQGNFWYSEAFGSFMWAGGGRGANAHFYLSTAPKPEGPWITPYSFYNGTVGNASLPAYSCQAHVSLLQNPATDKAIYLTWTETFAYTNDDVRITPLAYVEFE